MSDQALPTRTIQTTICGVTSSAEFTTARETLATTTDKDAQSLLGMMVCRNINLRVSREHAFTPELVRARAHRAKGLLLYVVGEEERHGVHQCQRCTASHLPGPFTTCVVQEGLFGGACANCLYTDKAHECTLSTNLPRTRRNWAPTDLNHLGTALHSLRTQCEGVLTRLARMEDELQAASENLTRRG